MWSNKGKMKNIVIVGGGTAGWITALMLKRKDPGINVTLIESEEIGILGAGEGTTPIFVETMDWLGISLSEFIEKTGCTFKNGIKFTNWTPEGNYYYHNFGSSVPIISPNTKNSFNQTFNQNSLYYSMTAYNTIKNEESDYSSMINENNKVPFVYIGDKEMHNPIYNYDQLAYFSIHFDARKVANFLKEKALDRGIKRIEGRVVDINENKDGNISSLILENSLKVNTDFVFDCSGLSKMFIGKHFNSEWKDLSSKLTTNAAIPFFLPKEKSENLPPYTESIAMKYGWVWKIPLQHRYGCGYVYNSNLVSYDNAKKELDEYLGFSVESPRSFNFNAGYYKTPWVKNCISIGLSSGFLEPLEATSIWTSIYFLHILLSDMSQLFDNSQNTLDYYNSRFCRWFEETADFIFLHYMGKRDDTDFWKHYNDKNNIPESIKEIFERWEFSIPTFNEFGSITDDRGFGLPNWFEVSYGLGLINIDKIKKAFEYNDWEKMNPWFDEIKFNQKALSDISMNHGELIKSLGGYKDIGVE
jgi:tryptophan halogenase